ncbi:helix-turn-helix transcriptional regulator [Streptomyces sp. YIM 98790]|uniref:helix-turn-helix domain-containing protein n=1 Tax=Streptomyces sp. YIM 98790 TaxID=2689077 RepID=UPI00140B7174|nr:helix-turn-helix transcriptional regulator [Streptomyces sp. YIM 98790]
MELNNGVKLSARSLIAAQLLRLRTRHGLSQHRLEEQLGFPQSYIAAVESGSKLPSEQLAEAFDTFFEPVLTFVELLRYARESGPEDYGRRLVPKERRATRLQVFTSSVIPGLLQTEEYAFELFQVTLPWNSEAENRQLVAERLKRQEVLDREDPPLHWAIIDEAALKRPMGGKQCMTGQLKHLLNSAGRWGMRVQVLPFAAGGHSMMGGSLCLMTMPNGSVIGYVESFKNGGAVESPEVILELVELFDVARSKALPEEESLALIGRYLQEHEND